MYLKLCYFFFSDVIDGKFEFEVGDRALGLETDNKW
jgi:hypothetical protein